MRATVVDDEAEQERLWLFADRFFPAYASYRRITAGVNRTIPRVQRTRGGSGRLDWVPILGLALGSIVCAPGGVQLECVV
jgi:hypothetical protein